MGLSFDAVAQVYSGKIFTGLSAYGGSKDLTVNITVNH